MSKLQTSLHSLPPGSVVYKQLEKSNAEMNAILDQAGRDEVRAAKEHQERTGDSWAESCSPCGWNWS